MRVLGIDPGKRRVGLALSDPGGSVASPLTVLEVRGVQALLEAIATVVAEHGVERLVVGYPLNMDGSAGPAARAAGRLARALEDRLGLPVELMDERLSSVGAGRAMRAAGLKARQIRGRLDPVAACLVLQAYLDRRNGGSGSSETEA